MSIALGHPLYLPYTTGLTEFSVFGKGDQPVAHTGYLCHHNRITE